MQGDETPRDRPSAEAADPADPAEPRSPTHAASHAEIAAAAAHRDLPGPAWGGMVLVRSLLVLIAAMFLSGLAGQQTWIGSSSAIVASVILWLGFVVAIGWAVLREGTGSFRRDLGLGFRAVDLLYALLFGLALRAASGVIDMLVYDRGSIQLPGYALFDGRLPDLFWFTGLLSPILVAPILEELFFRGVVQSSVQAILGGRIWPSRRVAVIASILVSSLLFAGAHLLIGPSGQTAIVTGLSTFLVGLVCGTLVALTGRITPAILTHIVFNASSVGLGLWVTFA